MAERDIDTASFREPAPRIVRLVALALLDEARDAARTFEGADATDPEPLHDFRVAVRRLRSWLRQWRDVLHDDVSRKDERRVRKIARATSAARDIDVHLAWLNDERHASGARKRRDISAVREKLEAERSSAAADALKAAHELQDLHERLNRQLMTYCVEVRDASTDERFGTALAKVIRDASHALAECLADVHRRADHEASHEARIAAKHLRYLLDAAAKPARGSAKSIRKLEQLQDVIGEEHDAHVFSSTLTTAGAPRSGVLVRRLRTRGTRAYARFADDWLDGAAAPFFAQVERVASRVARMGDATA